MSKKDGNSSSQTESLQDMKENNKKIRVCSHTDSDSNSDSGSRSVEKLSYEENHDDVHNISPDELTKAISLAISATSKKFGWIDNTHRHASGMSNPLSDLIPGYVAPMKLDSSSLDKFKDPKIFFASLVSETKPISISPKDYFVSKNFKMGKRDPAIIAKNKTNAGSGWFNFEATPNSDALQADIAIIRNRNYINQKKFYKASDFSKMGTHMVQLGTVIEGSTESIHTNKLSKKERKRTVAEEVMGETFNSKDDYLKKKFKNMQEEKISAGRKRVKRKSNRKGHFRSVTGKR